MSMNSPAQLFLATWVPMLLLAWAAMLKRGASAPGAIIPSVEEYYVDRRTTHETTPPGPPCPGSVQ